MVSLAVVLTFAAATGTKLPPPLAKEMAAAVLAVDKSLGLESWPTHGVKPCVDRGGPENPTKDVSREETERCAAGALGKGLPDLGRAYALAVLMAPMGPVTVLALGIDDATGWGAYSCDPGRKCVPIRIDPGTKWGKRLVERQAKACSDEATLWFPEGKRACPPAGP